MEDLMVQLLKEKNQNASLNQDLIYEKIQKKKFDTMDPLGRLCYALQQENKEGQSSTYAMENLLRLVKETALLVGQTDSTLSFYRRLNALDGTMNTSTQAKFFLKTKSDLFQKDNKNPFGQDFREQISEIVKVQKQPKQLIPTTVFKEAHDVPPRSPAKTKQTSWKAYFMIQAKCPAQFQQQSQWQMDLQAPS